MKKLYKKAAILYIAAVCSVFATQTQAQHTECLADFADGLFFSQMKENNIAGITFGAIYNDGVKITRGYGFSNIDAREKVDSNTAFRIGSISKLFVWVAVMQLVEEDKLNLDTPVNDYLLGFRLPPKYLPVTMRQLMAHTSGFEDNVLTIFSKSHEDITDLETYLASHLPAQIFEPGTTSAYSNYGVALAAYVVEQITGISFSEYVEQNIFEPLGMKQTTFRQPANNTLTDNKSLGYVLRNGLLVNPFSEYVLPYAAGGAVSSASDMLLFMNALLVPDTVNADFFLGYETINQMFSTIHTQHPEIQGMGYGFFRMQYKGLDIFWHGGNTYFFNSAFVLVPEHNTGFFFSSNTGETGMLFPDGFLMLLDYLFKLEETLIQNNRRPNGLDLYTGRYIFSRRNESGFSRIFNLFMSVPVTAVPQGLMIALPGSEPELYRQDNEPGIFTSGDNTLIFEKDSKGRVKRGFISQFPAVELHVMHWRESIGFNVLLLALIFIIIAKCIISPFKLYFKKTKRINQPFRWFMVPCALLIVVFFFLFFGRFASMEQVLFPNLEGFNLIMLIPLASLVFFVLAIITWFGGQVMAKQQLPRTLWQFVAFIVLVVFYFQMSYWNLLTIGGF